MQLFSIGPEGKGIETSHSITERAQRPMFSIGPEGKGIETCRRVIALILARVFSIGPEGKGIETGQHRRYQMAWRGSALALKEKGLRQRCMRRALVQHWP